MSNEINALQKFFNYLAENGKDADSVLAEADSNHDGYLIKSEFTKYLEGTGIQFTADEVSQIYKSLDTNTKGKIAGTKLNNRNALDSNEMAAMQNKLDAYMEVREALDEVFGSGYEDVTIPPELKAYVPRASVEESIMSRLNSNFECNNLAGAMNAAIAKTGANTYGHAKFTELLDVAKSQGKVPASFMGDENFEGILNSYIATLNESTDLSTIMDDIEDIVNGYFASAGIGTMPSSLEENGDLEQFRWNDAQGLNALQVTVLATRITNAINVNAETYSKFKTEFDSAIQGFINDTCQGGTFAQITDQLDHMDIATEFSNSKYGKALSVLVTYSDFSEPVPGETSQLNDAFYNALSDALTEDFAKGLAAADVNYVAEQGIYNTVLRTVYQMVLNGELENNDEAIRNKMIELIINNYAEFKDGLGVGDSSAPIDQLYDNVDTLVDKGGALAAVRTAAIAYLDAVTALGSEKLNSFIKAQFGGVDYKTAIKNIMAQSVIGSKIDEIKNKYEQMTKSGEIVLKVEPSDCYVQLKKDTDDNIINDGWTIQDPLPEISVGGKAQTISCKADVRGPDEQPLKSSLTNPITYGLVAVGGNTGSTAEINPDTGEITITPGTQDGTAIVKVKVMVNGVEIGTKEISITVKKQMSAEAESKDLENITYKGKSLNDMLLGNVSGSAIELCSFMKGSTNCINAAKNAIGSHIDELGTLLKNAGFDSDLVDNAIRSTKNYYAAALGNAQDRIDSTKDQKAISYSITYTDAHGVTHSEDNTYSQKTYYREGSANGGNWAKGMALSTTGIQLSESTANTNTYKMYVNSACLADKFMRFLRQELAL